MEDHLRLLKNFTHGLVLAYDADDAGQAAAERIYQWEARYDMRLSVADLPSGQDPADVGRADPAALVAAVSGARPFLRFRLDRLLCSADTGVPRAGPSRPKRPWRWWPSIPTTSFGTSTSWTWPSVWPSTSNACGGPLPPRGPGDAGGDECRCAAGGGHPPAPAAPRRT